MNALSCRFYDGIQKRGFAVKTPFTTIKNIEFKSKKIMQITEAGANKITMPLEASWNSTTSSIRIIPALQTSCKKPIFENPKHFYFGGLPALMQAFRKLEKLDEEGNRMEEVVYVTDANIPKTIQSGHQGHVHPSEWTAKECHTLNLCKAMLRGADLFPADDPSDLARYSYLHFPINVSDICKRPLEYLNIYRKFFQRRIVHNLTAKNGVSKQDRWVCDAIVKSLDYHQKVSDLIEEKTGNKTFERQGRVYWSPNLEGMKQKERTWKELGIKCEFIDEFEIRRSTLLKANSQLHVLKIFEDGKFFPEAPKHIIRYLQNQYSNFTYRLSSVKEISINQECGTPLMVLEEDVFSGKQSRTHVSTIFGSPGHSDVLRYDAVRNRWNVLWKEVPVSGVSTLWSCVIDKKEMYSRFDSKFLSDTELKQHVEGIIAAANLSNLHVTSWDCAINETTIELIARATQGANFNSSVADPSDLMNMTHNLNHYFIGDWTLLSAGTCTRKTWVSNVPEFFSLGGNSGLLHGLSGLGYSFSGAPFEDLIHD